MRVNEIFYSIQGEGYHTGTAAVFIRLSGCNLKCPFCDTDFSGYREMTEGEIVGEVCRLSFSAGLVVITGGEPTLQDCTALIDRLHRIGYSVAMESNGTHRAPSNLDFLTVSPKVPFVGKTAGMRVKRCNELKHVYDGEREPEDYGIEADHYYIQPCDTGDPVRNNEIIEKSVEFIKRNPKWRMSLQTQKILKVR